MEDSELSIDLYNKISDTTIVAQNRAPYGNGQKGFRGLRVWQAGMDLAETCYRASQTFPTSEQFGLANQLRRAAVSITANIAEGWGRNTTPELGRFIDISIGSLCEVESLVEVSKRLEYISPEALKAMLEQANKVRSMQHRLRVSLRS